MFKVLIDECKPTRGSKFSACVDLYASEDCVIGAGETKIVGLGVAIDSDFNFLNRKFNHFTEEKKKEYKEWFLSHHYMQLNPRSGFRVKSYLSHTGIIDMDYPKEIKIIVHKPMTFFDVMLKVFTLGVVDVSKTFKKGDKIAQITLMEHKSYLFGIESEDERDGGFGSTGE
jgi:dUTPase